MRPATPRTLRRGLAKAKSLGGRDGPALKRLETRGRPIAVDLQIRTGPALPRVGKAVNHSRLSVVMEGMENPGAPLTHYVASSSDNARWAELSLRPIGIVVATPMKSGTTWLQMICALLVFQSPHQG